MKKLTNNLIAFALFALCLIVFVCLFKSKSTAKTSAHTTNVKTIIIDAGHGGFDGGALSDDGTYEKDINLNIAKKLQAYLRLSGFDTVMTRETDISTESDNGKKSKKESDLFNRLQLMNKYDDSIFVSIHLNKFTSASASGTQTFYSQKSDGSENLAECIQSAIKQNLQPENNRTIKKGTSGIYILRNATVPAVIVECGFLSNPADLQNLKDENYQTRMAFSVFCGIINYIAK